MKKSSYNHILRGWNADIVLTFQKLRDVGANGYLLFRNKTFISFALKYKANLIALMRLNM